MPAVFWRVIFPNLAVPTGGLGFENTGSQGVHCSGIEMRASIGSANLIDVDADETSFFASSDGALSTNSIPNAFKPYQNGRVWVSRAGLSGDGPRIFPQWVGYRFPSAVEIEEITMTGNNGSYNTTMPHRFALQYSDSLNGPWVTKYVWLSGPWPWELDGTDTRYYNSTNAQTNTIFNTFQAVSLLFRNSQEVQSTSLQTVSSIRRTSKVVSSRVEVLTLIFIEDSAGILFSRINIGLSARGETKPPEIGDDGRKIILKRGPGIDLPGKPRRVEPRDFLKGLDEAELAFSNDEGRLFLGSDPARLLPQYRRLAYPYRNIEVIGENSTEGFARMHGARKREGDNNDYFLTVLYPTPSEGQVAVPSGRIRSILEIFANAISIPSIVRLLNIDATTFTNETRNTGGISISATSTNDILTITKPRAPQQGIIYDAYSLYPTDTGTNNDRVTTWNNQFTVFGSNGGPEVILYSGAGLSVSDYANADAAYNALNTLLPMTFTGYQQYRVSCITDASSSPDDNRGGISLLATLSPRI